MAWCCVESRKLFVDNVSRLPFYSRLSNTYTLYTPSARVPTKVFRDILLHSRMARTFTTLLFVLSCRWQEIVNDRHKSDGNAATWTSEPSRWPVEQSAHKFKYSSRGRTTTWRRWGQPLKASDVVWICAWSRISSSLLYPLILLLLLLSSSHTALYLSIFFYIDRFLSFFCTLLSKHFCFHKSYLPIDRFVWFFIICIVLIIRVTF